MAEQRTEVVVVGAGLMGASAAYALARRGHAVALLEQFDLMHRRGSSHGASRIFRLAYDDVDYVRLAQAALPLWREAERELGRDLLTTTGGIDLGTPEALEGVENALHSAGAAVERVSASELRRRFPAYATPDGWEALFQPDGGVLDADASRRGFAHLAARHGAAVHEHTRVIGVESGADSAVVVTEGGRWRAEMIVVAAAGWSNRILDPLDLHVPLTVTREHVAYFPIRAGMTMLPFIWHDGGRFEYYGLPNGNTGDGKVGQHGAGPECDPDSEGIVDPARVEPVAQFVDRHLPGLQSVPESSETCLYASTPDDDFVVDRAGPVVIGMGFGGHGFKFGAVIGKLLADVAEGGRTEWSDRFSRARFWENAALR